MPRFDSIRASQIRKGDLVPQPLSWGGWDRTKAIKVSHLENDATLRNVIVVLEDGQVFRAVHSNQIPFISGAR